MQPEIVQKLIDISEGRSFFCVLKNGFRYKASNCQLQGDTLLFNDRWGEGVAVLVDSISLFEPWRERSMD